MFQFPRYPPGAYYSSKSLQPRVTGHYPRQVSQFGHPRIKACSRLPVAYRSLLRPSSVSDAKASAKRPL